MQLIHVSGWVEQSRLQQLKMDENGCMHGTMLDLSEIRRICINLDFHNKQLHMVALQGFAIGLIVSGR